MSLLSLVSLSITLQQRQQPINDDRAELALRLGTEMLLSRAASVIAAMVRGRLGRRRQLTFMALRIVEGAHAQLLKEVSFIDRSINQE